VCPSQIILADAGEKATGRSAKRSCDTIVRALITLRADDRAVNSTVSGLGVGPLARVRALNRADLAVLGFCALGVGNLWARLGAGNPAVAPVASDFVFGFALIALAGGLCYLAIGRPASMPGAIVCTAAIAAQALLQPALLMPLQLVYAIGLVLAIVPLVHSPRVGWALVALGAAVTAIGLAHSWAWGSSTFDVFTEVQASTQALLHGHNPYGPVFPIFLDSPAGHPRFGSGSLNYGPMVVLLSLPARLLGDVRLTVVALNVAILAAIIVWTRRGIASGRVTRTIAALWVASPFIPFMVLTEWTDTFCIAGLAWWLVLRERHRNWAIVALTVGLASKPSMLPLMVPLLFWDSAARRELLWSAVATVVIVAPFALWTGMAQFVYDTVGIYTDLLTRHDSANLNGLASVLGGGLLPGALLLAGLVATVVLFTLRRPRDYGDLLVAGAGLLIFVCCFGKQAFLNYYFNAAMALLFVAGSGKLAPRVVLHSPLGVLVRLRSKSSAHAPALRAGVDGRDAAAAGLVSQSSS
jgi:Glycosyltransferase family 87